jgi:exonuclease VII small subunit
MKKHTQQVAAWGKLLGHCNTFGDSYKPSKDSMKRTALEALLNESENQITAVHNAETFLVRTINERREAFRQLPFIGTRVVVALEATGASPDRVNEVNTIRKRFRRQALPKKDVARNAVPAPEEAPKKRKIPHGDFNSKVDNLELLISQLENGPPYAPEEEDIAITGLKQFLAKLKQCNETVAQAQLQLHVAKGKRNELLYGKDGIYHLARLVKRYVHSVYGFKSTQFKTIRKIKFQK